MRFLQHTLFYIAKLQHPFIYSIFRRYRAAFIGKNQKYEVKLHIWW